MGGDPAPQEVARRLPTGMARGVLSFPLTAFHADGTLDPDGFRTHVAPRDGLAAQLEHLAARTRLPLIAYQRGEVAYSVGSLRRVARVPNVIRQDGHSDLDRLQRLTLAATSAVHAFAPRSRAPSSPRSRRTTTAPSTSRCATSASRSSNSATARPDTPCPW